MGLVKPGERGWWAYCVCGSAEGGCEKGLWAGWVEDWKLGALVKGGGGGKEGVAGGWA